MWDTEVDDPTAGYSLTIAPQVYKGKVIIGSSGAEYGVRGFVDAYNAENGQRAWRFWTIPDKGWEGKWSATTPEGEKLNRELNKEKADFAKYADSWQRGGGSTWTTPAVDPETDTIFIMVGNPSPDLDGEVRPGDNLFTESMVAIDAGKGTYKWHYQYVPHDVWDLDAVPLGWRVKIDFENRGLAALPHSLVIINEIAPLPIEDGTAAFPRALTIRLVEGLLAGEKDSLDFVANKEGRFLFFCGVTGHGVAGMWDYLVVSKDATAPTVRVVARPGPARKEREN